MSKRYRVSITELRERFVPSFPFGRHEAVPEILYSRELEQLDIPGIVEVIEKDNSDD